MSYRTPTTASKASSEKGSATRALSLKHELEERQALEKANFELKMKVIQLEESLSKFSRAEIFAGASEAGETTTLRQQLESKTNELEQKNVLIAKAKTAIEALKLKDEGNTKTIGELEEKVDALAVNERAITGEFKKQFDKLDAQFKTLKSENDGHVVAAKTSDLKKSELEERCSHLARQVKDLEEAQSFWDFEKKASDRELIEARSAISKLNDELSHSKKHITIYEGQLHELSVEIERLKSVETSLNSSNEELSMTKRSMADMKESHDSQVSKLHETHLSKLKELRENHSIELERMKSVGENLSLREAHEVKEELSSRLHEKHSALEIALYKYESSSKALESSIEDNKKKDTLIRDLQSDILKRDEELRRSVVLQERLSSDYSEATLRLQRLESEKSQLESRYEEVSDAFETARENLREMKNYMNSLDGDSKRFVKELELYRGRANALDEVTRENERLKFSIANTTKDLAESQVKLEACSRDNVRLVDEMKRAQAKEELLSSKLLDCENLEKALVTSKESSAEALEYERKRASNMETTTEELRKAISSMSLEQEKLQQSYAIDQQKSRELQSRHSEVTQGLGSVCTNLLEACVNWEATLTTVLEGIPSSASVNAGEWSRFSNSVPSHGNESILSMSSFELVRKVSIQTERISIKIEKLSKLRKTLDGYISKAVSSISEKFQNAQDKVVDN